jgi:prevent-host-death family protein
MMKQVTATEAKSKFLAILDEVEQGEIIEITRHGLTIARIYPAKGPGALKGLYAGVVKSNASDDELFSTGVSWDLP